MTQEERDRLHGERERLREEAMMDRLQVARHRAAGQADMLQRWVAALREEGSSPMACPSHEEVKATYDEIAAAKATLFNLSQGVLVSC